VVDFDDHKRQRKVMQPAFNTPQLRNLFPVFIRHTQKVRPHQSRRAMAILTASKLVQILKREIAGDSNRQSLEMNVYDYTTRATLDITGESELISHLLPSPSALIFQTAVFEYQFGALDNKQDKLRDALNNLE
jgi:hypothetical protein